MGYDSKSDGFRPLVNLQAIGELISASYRPQFQDFDLIETNLLILVGQRLRHFREEQGKSQKSMAAILGVSFNQYRNYEDSRHWMPMSTVARYMIFTGIPFQYLFVNSCYESFFSSLAIHQEGIKVQSFVGRCSDQAYNGLIYLLCDRLGIVPLEDFDTAGLSWPRDVEVEKELRRYYRIVAEGLRSLREVLRLSVEELAGLLGIGAFTLIAYERGDEKPQFSVLMAMRLWASTGVNPLLLTYGTHFYERRTLQHKRMEYLNRLSKQIPATILMGAARQLVEQLDLSTHTKRRI